MTNVTSEMVKTLRELTGAGMMDCKKALVEENGDIEKAKDFLRKKGLSKAAKKSDRVTAEGLVAILNTGNNAVIAEVNSETDFVAKNSQFQQLVSEIVKNSLENDADLEKVKSDMSENIINAISSIGENITLRRVDKISGNTVIDYMHMAIKTGSESMGKIGVLVAIEGDSDKAKEIGKQIAMHIAATSPICMNVNEVPSDTITREKEIAIEKARTSGKPEAVIEKMTEGALRKFYEEVVLMEQFFVVDPNKKIKDVLKENNLVIKSYIRYGLGEGIEKKECDFATEVMSAVKGE